MIALFGFIAVITHAHAALPVLEGRLGAASVKTANDTLTVGTGIIERQWRWTGQGFVTCAVKDLVSDREWADAKPAVTSDWQLPGTSGDAHLIALSARPDDDEGFTTRHLVVTAEILYPASGVTVKYTVWAYPDAPGLRTQLWIKGAPAKRDKGDRVDYVPVNVAPFTPRAIGYFNDTQHRHTPNCHLIREERVPAGTVPWASILCLEDVNGGLAMVKESHKCVNQSGANTGSFNADVKGLWNTGSRLGSADVRPDEYRWCWASWVLVYGPGDFSREMAIKEFDRLRYPVVFSRDAYIKANTWGSGNTSRDSRDKGMEAEVLKEIDSVADLGIDILQIDDGWQISTKAKTYSPDGGIGWRPHPQVYPDGWTNVVAKAKQRGVRLGVWAPSEAISLEEMKWNYDRAGFEAWKLDFANMSNADKIDRNMSKARDFIRYTGHQAHIAWDVTENAMRYGYFWARDCGSVFLANRKPNFPANTICNPWLMLREHWELARYCNLNKFQLDIQNFELVNRQKSDAHLYSHSYEVALGLMGIPLFFQTTGLYTPEARNEIRPLIALYKQYRAEMFADYVFPIGEEPNHANWSGFQWCHPRRTSGYLLIFRDRLNKEPQKTIALRNLPGATLSLIDLRTGRGQILALDRAGNTAFTIDHPAGFLFARYEVQESHGEKE